MRVFDRVLRVVLGRRQGMFGSRTVTAHVTRGFVAAAAVAAGLASVSHAPAFAAVAIATAIVAMRGCPMCWTFGLVETIAAKMGRTWAIGHCDVDTDQRMRTGPAAGGDPQS